MMLSLGLAVAVAEVVLRAGGFRMPRILPPDVRHSYDFNPNGRFIYRGYLPGTFEDFENEVGLNSQGFHDYEHPAARPATNTYRIMILGDSYVAALSVPIEDNFCHLIERKLRVEDPLRCGSYENIALGRGSQAQETELEWLRKYGPEFKPDLVLLVFFCGNDVMENSDRLYGAAQKFAAHYVSQVVPRKIEFFNHALIFPRSRLNGLVAEALTTWYSENLFRFDHSIRREDLESPELGVYQSPLSPEWENAFTRSASLLDHIRSNCDGLHAQLTLACLVSPQAVGDLGHQELIGAKQFGLDLKRPERWIASWCTEQKVPYLLLSGDLGRAGPRRVFWRHDGHLNECGNKVVADALYPFLANVARDHAKRIDAPTGHL